MSERRDKQNRARNGQGEQKREHEKSCSLRDGVFENGRKTLVSITV